MRSRILRGLLFWVLAALPSLGFANVSFHSIPSSVESNASYYVGAHMYAPQGGELNVWKNGGWFSGGSGWGWPQANGWTSDAGPQTVEYFAEGSDWYYGYSYYSWAYVNVSGPPNQPPSATVVVDGHGSGATVTRPYGGSINVTVRYRATDPDGNLARIRPQVWHPDTGHFTNDGGAWTGQSGGSGEVARTITLDRNGNWYFWTDAEDSNNVFVNSGAWTDGFRLNIVEAAPPNQNPQTQSVSSTSPVTGQAATFTGHATDPDGNLQTMHFYVTGPGLPGWNYVGSAGISGGSAVANLNWTPPQPGGFAVHIRAVDTNNEWDWNANVSAGFTAINRNPSVSMQILDAGQNIIALDGNGRARIPTNTNFHIRVSGSDPDGRLLRLYSRVNNAAGVGFAYEQRDVSGGSASWTFGPYNTGTSVGVWDVWAHAQDQDDTGYQWQGGGWWGTQTPDIEVFSPNVAPVSNISASASTIGFGQSVTVTGTISDADGNLYAHGILRLRDDGATWLRPSTAPDYSRTGWNSFAVDTGIVWSSVNHVNDTASGGSSSRSASVLPLSRATYTFHTNGHDNALWSPGASVVVTVIHATPTATFASRTLNTSGASYTVLAGDLNAAFANPFSGAVAAPTGTVTYSIVGAGAAVTAGTVLPTGQAYTVRASYPGNANYNAATIDAVWTVADVATYTLTVENGTGGASGLSAGAVRSISANTPPVGQVFANWTLVTGPGSLANPNAASTTFTVGFGNATVRANYVAWNPDADQDGDGIPNGIEQQLGTNPNSAAQADGANSTQLKVQRPKQ